MFDEDELREAPWGDDDDENGGPFDISGEPWDEEDDFEDYGLGDSEDAEEMDDPKPHPEGD